MSKMIKIIDTSGAGYICVADVGAVIVEYPRTVHIVSHRGDPLMTLNCTDSEDADKSADQIVAAIEREAAGQ